MYGEIQKITDEEVCVAFRDAGDFIHHSQQQDHHGKLAREIGTRGNGVRRVMYGGGDQKRDEKGHDYGDHIASDQKKRAQ